MRGGAALGVAALACVALLALLAVGRLPASTTELENGQGRSLGLPANWHRSEDASTGRTYYWNRALGTSQWTPPAWPHQTVLASQRENRERRVQSLGGDDEEKLIGSASGDADWPADLRGADGDDTSWIVGMHREPLWSDAQTYASGGLTVAALKGRADHGHRFQRTTNPFSDKRRTFDPYAQATEEGRAEYPWDAFKDPQYYGDADCSDGKLTAQCQEKPDQAKLDEKKAEWKQKYDEWYNPAEEEKKAAKEEGGAKKAVGGAMLKHAAEVLPWARRSYSQFRHSANRMKQAADRDIAAIADAGAHQQGTHYAGGEPVAASLGRVLKRVQGEVGAEGEMLHLPALGDLAHRFLRARRPDSEAWLGAAGGARLQELAGVGAGSTGKGGVSIWETPKQVSHHGLFGLAGAAPKHKAKQALVVPTGKAAKGRGPLPAVQAEAMRVLSEQHHRGARAGGKGKPAPATSWQEKDLQVGVLQKQSTQANLARAVKDHDAHMLEKVAGLSWSKMASLEDAAEAVEKEINPSVATPKAAKTAPRRAMQPWEEKVLQQGAMRHEGVEANLKHALGRRTVQLLKQKAGWQSEKELLRAEMFATNLEHAIKLRRTEEKKAPLMPADLNAAVDRAEGKKPRANRGRAHAESSKVAGEALKAEVEEHTDERLVERISEDRPVVKAYENKVSTDEQEYEAEVSQERATLSDLHTDQLKLAKEVAKEEHPRHFKAKPAKKKPLSAVERLALPADDDAAADTPDVATPVASSKKAAAYTGKGGVPPVHGLSSAAADDEMDAYFATQAQHASSARVTK